MIIKTLYLLGFQGMLASGETVLFTWQLNMLRRSLSIREGRFLTLILDADQYVHKEAVAYGMGKMSRECFIRFSPKWMIPFRLMVDVAVRKLYYADCILVTHFKLIFIY